MIQFIVQTATGMTLMGAAPVNHGQIELALKFAPMLVAADGGANAALAAGVIPDAVIGDFDSIDPVTLARIPPEKLHHVAEQETTDFEKCLQRIRAPFILALGMTGARLDHTLAAMTTLVKFPQLSVILLSEQDVCFLCPAEWHMTLPVGTRLSLFPMGAVTGKSTGLKWPIDGIEFAPNARTGTSNQTSAARVSLTFDQRSMVVILPASCLPNVVASLK